METLRACFLGRLMQSTQRIVMIIGASLLFTYVCASPHAMFISYLPLISALLAIGRLQLSSSLPYHASSASLQLIHLYTPMLVGAALLSHHTAEAKLQVVNDANFKNTSYYGSPVSLSGKFDDDIVFTLDERASRVNVTWEFIGGDGGIQLEKCDATDTAKFEISDSCKWEFLWKDDRSFELSRNNKHSPTFYWRLDNLPRLPIRKLQVRIRSGPSMSVCVVADDGTCASIGDLSLPLFPPEYCMLATDPFSVNFTNTAPGCPIKVTIINAKLLYDDHEPERMHNDPQSANTTMVPASTTPRNAAARFCTAGSCSLPSSHLPP